MKREEFDQVPDRLSGVPNPTKTQTAFPEFVAQVNTDLEALAQEQLAAFERLAEARKAYVVACSDIQAAHEKALNLQNNYNEAVAGLPGKLRAGRGPSVAGPIKPGSLALSDDHLRKAIRAYRAGAK